MIHQTVLPVQLGIQNTQGIKRTLFNKFQDSIAASEMNREILVSHQIQFPVVPQILKCTEECQVLSCQIQLQALESKVCVLHLWTIKWKHFVFCNVLNTWGCLAIVKHIHELTSYVTQTSCQHQILVLKQVNVQDSTCKSNFKSLILETDL